jgi:hypothetical protein
VAASVFRLGRERPSVSCCSEAEGQTIGRPPLRPGERNSQFTAYTSRGDRPSRGAAASFCCNSAIVVGARAEVSASRTFHRWSGSYTKSGFGNASIRSCSVPVVSCCERSSIASSSIRPSRVQMSGFDAPGPEQKAAPAMADLSIPLSVLLHSLSACLRRGERAAAAVAA